MQIKAKTIEEQLKKKNPKKKISLKKHQWIEKEFNEEKERSFLEKRINPILSRLLSLRNVDVNNIEEYLNPKIKNILPDPYILDHMELATNKIVEIIKGKKIGIFGDFDVDGSTSTALLSKYFDDVGVEFEFYIPDRVTEGYGPNIEAFKKLVENNCELIITLDCGTTAFNEIDFLNKKGVDIIVIDHHKQSELLPNAFAIVNPNKNDDNSDLVNLCAAGVTFFLLTSLNRRLKEIKFFKDRIPNLILYLDLVALGTICDLVKIDHVNRAFVKQGLKIINHSSNLGISSIVNESKIENEINDYHLGFVIGPRINAGGRVGKSSLGAELLLCNEKKIANVMALKLGEFNNLRKKIEKEVESKALEMVEDNEKIICVSSENWHPGVIGIVASRLVEQFNRPSIVISEEEKLCKGSCRSVQNFDISNLIVKAVNEGLLLNGGGHKMAGGFSIEKEKIKKFKDYLSSKYFKVVGEIIKNYDYKLNINNINTNLYDEIVKLSPFGPGNQKPRFLLANCNLSFIKVVGNKHHSLLIEDNYGNKTKGIVFNSVNHDLGNFLDSFSGESIDLVATLRRNTWNNEISIQLQVEDIIVN